MTRPRAPLAVRLYGVAAGLLAPLVYRRISAGLMQQGTAPERVKERLGHATAQRPKTGKLIWFHAASVGESVSVLRLIGHMGAADPNRHFLLTSGTAAAAEVIGQRLPPRCQHQFSPLDTRRAVRRFLDHWRPDAAIFVESELWPQMLGQTAARDIPLALINARLSEGSARNWQRFAGAARYLLGPFRLIHCQDEPTALAFQRLGLSRATAGRNLKSLSGPLPLDQAELERLHTGLAGRPLWLAASTHAGEDEIMLAAHRQLLRDHPDALLILVPRHPGRATDIELLVAQAGLSGVRRATGGRIAGQVQVYLADTLGETGLWYALSPVTCLCGSFTADGGHNPYEPAYAGSAILHGPHCANFRQAYRDLAAMGGAVEIDGADNLATVLRSLLGTPGALADLRARTGDFIKAQEDVLATLNDALTAALRLD